MLTSRQMEVVLGTQSYLSEMDGALHGASVGGSCHHIGLALLGSGQLLTCVHRKKYDKFVVQKGFQFTFFLSPSSIAVSACTLSMAALLCNSKVTCAGQ